MAFTHRQDAVLVATAVAQEEEPIAPASALVARLPAPLASASEPDERIVFQKFKHRYKFFQFAGLQLNAFFYCLP